MRVLGIDFGGKRIGVAIGETEHNVASPRPQIEATGTLRLDAVNIVSIAKKEEAAKVVIGTPVVGTEETKMLAPLGAAKLDRIIRRYLRDRNWNG